VATIVPVRMSRDMAAKKKNTMLECERQAWRCSGRHGTVTTRVRETCKKKKKGPVLP
jgi:hypothetical protein